jgi:ribosomal protein L12E/L44/L45/RPP1/RPP2
MVAVPGVSAVISPVVKLIVATAELEEDQVPPVAVEVKVEVEPTQSDWVPVRVPALTSVDTVTVLVAVAVMQPPVAATV